MIAACFGVGSRGDLGFLELGYIYAVSCVRRSMIPHARICCMRLKEETIAADVDVVGITSCR